MWSFNQRVVMQQESNIFVRDGLDDNYKMDFSVRIAKTDFDYLQISCSPSEDLWGVWATLSVDGEKVIMGSYDPEEMLKALKIATKKLQKIVNKIEELDND